MFLKKLGLWLVLSLILLMVSVILFAGQGFGDIEIIRKNLGDINGDGNKEIAIEETSWGVSSCSIGVKILSGKKTIFKLPTFSGDTADGYKVVEKKIVVWRGNWQSVQSKWEPHYYNFTWYGWDVKNKTYVIT